MQREKKERCGGGERRGGRESVERQRGLGGGDEGLRERETEIVTERERERERQRQRRRQRETERQRQREHRFKRADVTTGC